MNAVRLTNLPSQMGLGLRLPHIRQILAEKPAVAWFETHPENFFGGGANIAALEAVRVEWPLSLHGVGMGLGSAVAPDAGHLEQVASLVERLQPAAVSEHLCWNRVGAHYFNDLLPMPYTDEALALLVERVDAVQSRLRRTILIENVSSYIEFTADIWAEADFLAELARRSGCGILLDVNNFYVNQCNLGRDARQAMDALPVAVVGEIHIAGFETRDDGMLLDTHGTPVCEAVWQLLDYAWQRFGPVPTLLERDTHLPPLADLLAEVAIGEERMARHVATG
ncbi:MNIO family bufferin maturase [Parachitinimonas caeni]|uniref:DUF692 domain-containing protein n=1 Tax=Parachitinimonas caeni TaxID=3031301 RepID=A0ABT7E1V3_9NEIS|nr:DUF692 domain-containing protein [Parachitinimonas caeni]MDK2126285.1 DUF692 domain-containing protein [Parachitinimonas caeni]